MSVRRVLIFAVVFAVTGLGINQVGAEDDQPAVGLDSQQLLQRLEAQDQRIRELESRLNTTERPLRMLPTVMESNNEVLYRLEALESAYSDVASRSLFDDIEGVDTHGEKWKNKWRGRIHGDWVNWADQSPALGGMNYFEFRRLRLGVAGKGYGVYDYKVTVDMESEADTSNGIDDPFISLKDVYVGMHDVPWLGYVRFGHFKAPFSL